MQKYIAKIDFYKNSALAFDMLDQTAAGIAKSSLDFRRQLIEHCRRWGYNYKIKSIKRLNAEG